MDNSKNIVKIRMVYSSMEMMNEEDVNLYDFVSLDAYTEQHPDKISLFINNGNDYEYITDLYQPRAKETSFINRIFKIDGKVQEIFGKIFKIYRIIKGLYGRKLLFKLIKDRLKKFYNYTMAEIVSFIGEKIYSDIYNKVTNKFRMK